MMRTLAFERHGCVAMPTRSHDESKLELFRLTLHNHMVCRKFLNSSLMSHLRLAYICRRRMMRTLAFDRHGCVAELMRCHDESK